MRWAALLFATLIPAFAQSAESLYAASVRSRFGADAHLIAGNLYSVNVSTGVFSLIGAVRANGTMPIGVTGLADHPVSGVLYGITAESSPNFPRSLVTLDVRTGVAKVIGDLGAPGTDIAFDRSGTLFVWLRQTSQIATVDLASGAAHPLGQPGAPSETGGLAIHANGRAYLAATGADGFLDTIDTASGAITRGPALKGAPFPGGINSLTISPGGVIFAVNTNLGSPANTLLVRIDPASGAVSQLSPLPNDTDALVFVEPPRSWSTILSSRVELMVIALLIVACVVALLLPRWKRAS